MPPPHVTVVLHDVGECVDQVLERLGPRIVLALPLGIGKPNPTANEFYARAARDRSIDLTILTALSLRKPEASSDLERRFLEPLVERLFGDHPELEYARAQHADALPPNVRVIEFYFEPGASLGSRQAQQDYLCANYTHVAREAMARGVNVIAHLVAKRAPPGGSGDEEISLGSNPDVTLDLLPLVAEARAAGRDVVLIGEVHPRMPFMLDRALVARERFDYLVEDPRSDYELFAPPNPSIGTVDHAIGLFASGLVKDGGTLQVGIGQLGDALAYALLLRHQRNAQYREALERLDPARRCEAVGGREPFQAGLFASTEMFVDSLLDLFRAGILKRRVFDDLAQQAAAESGAPPPGGQVLHAGFFLGPRAFYQALRDMSVEERALFGMRGVGYVNQLYGGDQELRVRQRRHARFVNTTMMVTLLGAAVSDALEDGRVVSGVGGQYNFVAMAHALPDGRSVLCVRSTREKYGRVSSNIVWSYGHVTIPRHLRDLVVTEYGVADLRGRTDQETIAALLEIADSRFQGELLARAKAAGKIRADHQIPEAFRNNTPERLEHALAAPRRAGLFGEYPFGTDLTAEEVVLVRALESLQTRSASFRGRLGLLARALARGGSADRHRTSLQRMGLERPRGARERLLRRLVVAALEETAQAPANPRIS